MIISKKISFFKNMLLHLRRSFQVHTIPAVQDENICFIISAPRSGSTWTKKAINHHPDIYCTEQRLFGRFSEFWCDDIATGKQRLRITLDAYVDALAGPLEYQSLKIDRELFKHQIFITLAHTLIGFGREKSGKRVFADKITPYIGTSSSVIQSIQTYFPETKIIYLLRDGRDVMTSGVFDWLRKKTQHKELSQFQIQRYQKFVKQESSVQLDHFFERDEIETWADYWREPLRYIQKYAGLTIFYEKMKENQEKELSRIFHYLNVEGDDKIIEKCVKKSSFQKMSGGRNPGEEVPTAKTRKGISGDWKNYFTRADGELFHFLAGKYLLDFGYETDEKWYEDLPLTRKL